MENHNLHRVYDQYSFQVIPVMGQIVAGQWQPYQYLVESIRQFPDQVYAYFFIVFFVSIYKCSVIDTNISFQEKFKTMIENAGFRQVTYENISFGVVAIHSGFKI